MYSIYLLSVILAVSSAVAYATRNGWKWMDVNFTSQVVAILSGGVLSFMLTAIPISRLIVAVRLQAIEAIRTMNAGGEGLEMTHWRTTVSKANVDLAQMKYYASNPWTSAWYPKAVLAVEPIR